MDYQKQSETEVRIHENHSTENYDLNKENIQVDKSQAIQARLFPNGMIRTLFQIMLNWPLKFGNNTDNSPT